MVPYGHLMSSLKLLKAVIKIISILQPPPKYTGAIWSEKKSFRRCLND